MGRHQEFATQRPKMALVRLDIDQPVLGPTIHEDIVKAMGRVGTVLKHHVSHHSVECR